MNLTKVRVDKYLWSIRIFKSRSLATEACRAGHIFIDKLSVKPAHLIHGGENIIVRKSGFNFQIKVIQLIEKRVSADLAKLCYQDMTPPEELHKYEAWFAVSRAQLEFRPRGDGRPTKKERRDIDRFKSWEDLDD